MNITFWQNAPSHHLAPVQRALANVPGVDVRVVVAEDIGQNRIDLGWSLPNLGKAAQYTLSGDFQSVGKIAATKSGVHLVGGIGGPFNNFVLRELRGKADGPTALMLERGIFLGGPKDHLRPWYHAILLRSLRSKFDFVFAFGSLGVEYYRNIGVPADRIFPFLYQCDFRMDQHRTSENDPLKLIYVGALNHRKGVDLIPSALSKLGRNEWTLTIVGRGPLERSIRQSFEDAGLSYRVNWAGVIQNSEIMEALGEHDVCIVPSRHDGWGAAVNEAIEAGLCVVTTPGVGAKDLIIETGAGVVADAPTSDALADALRDLLGNPRRIRLAREAAIRVRKHFRGEAVAEYTLDVLKHVSEGASAPLSPWVKAAREEAANSPLY